MLFLSSATVAGEWSATRSYSFIPEERAPINHWMKGWLGPTIGPDFVQMNKSCITGNRTPAVRPVSGRYNAWAIPTPIPDTVTISWIVFLQFQVHASSGRHTELPVLWSVPITADCTLLCCLLRCLGNVFLSDHAAIF
jgi:hypothetical protein